MDPTRMQTLINEHLEAEARGDVAGALAVYTADVEHDVVGSPLGVLTGPGQAARFYEHLLNNVKVESWAASREYYGPDFAVVEHTVTASVIGELLGLPGHGRRIEFRMLHIWEFADDQISRENAWLDGGAIARQLAGQS
jgi:steroid delta-isomerase-like uncharacterized protein